MERKPEWSWSNSPLLVPLAYERREWNTVYTSFVTAEYSGSEVIVFHIRTDADIEPVREEFLGKVDRFSSELNVVYRVDETRDVAVGPGPQEIADQIVSAAHRHGCQAIVMSAYREAFLKRLFGRVSDRVTRKARCRVVLVETPRPGVTIPEGPKRILLPFLRDEFATDPLILAAAFTSSASPPGCELIAARVVKVPSAMPLEAFESSALMKRVERRFAYHIGVAISSLGRLISPRILVVRDPGAEVANYADEAGVDMIVLQSGKPGRLGPMVTKEEYSIVKRSLCVVLVAFARQQTVSGQEAEA